MPDIKISDLSAAGSASGAMQLEVNDSGTSKRITVDQIKSFLLSAGSISATELGTDAVTTIKISNGAVTPAKLSSGAPSWDSSNNVTVGGNLLFSNSSSRFRADFSSTTHSSRFIFQSSVANGVTQVGFAPNGTATFTTLDIFSSSDVDNASVGRLRVNTSDVSLNSTITGTGTYLPLTIQTGGAERVRISTAGGLSVGTTTDPGAGSINATGNITGYFSSDIRLKENVKDIPNALETVESIGGKLFDWTDEYLSSHGGEDSYFNRKSDFGVIAQDVQAVFPVAVRERPDGTLAVDYEKLCALAFAAIKELSDKVAELGGE